MLLLLSSPVITVPKATITICNYIIIHSFGLLLFSSLECVNICMLHREMNGKHPTVRLYTAV